MGRLDDVMARHVWLRFAGGWMLATAVVVAAHPTRSRVDVAARVVAGSAGAVWLAVRRHRREKAVAGGTADDLVVMEHHLLTGEPPAGPRRREAMRALVARRLYLARYRRAALVLLAVLYCAGVVCFALTEPAWRAVPECVAVGALFGYAYAAGARALHRLRRMRDVLAGDRTAGPALAGGPAAAREAPPRQRAAGPPRPSAG
ncbi:hypothetical protein [Actinacidiphila yeochonensis]|uniref:hypothetical protein n=1 Tax=Actinacidiphila yeochonensis TaxID=89050 RepID=UPI000566CC3F|nr:hypothetical protein [Actinacidiphila yeochonensis]